MGNIGWAEVNIFIGGEKISGIKIKDFCTVTEISFNICSDTGGNDYFSNKNKKKNKMFKYRMSRCKNRKTWNKQK